MCVCVDSGINSSPLWDSVLRVELIEPGAVSILDIVLSNESLMTHVEVGVLLIALEMCCHVLSCVGIYADWSPSWLMSLSSTLIMNTVSVIWMMK